MTDDIDSALAVVEGDRADGMPAVPADAGVVEIAERLMAMLREVSFQDVDLRKPEQRTDALLAYEALSTLGSQLSAKARLLRVAFLRYMVQRDTKMLLIPTPHGQQAIKYEAPRNEYQVSGNHAAEMYKDLLPLAGVELTREEIEDAVRPVVSYQLNHAKLNALSRRSGTAKSVIDAHRTLIEPDPNTGSLKFPGGR